MDPDAMGPARNQGDAGSEQDLRGIPRALREIVQLFENLPESERRETLTSFAGRAGFFEPLEGEPFDFGEERQDAVCTDRVGVYVRVEQDGALRVRMRLGPEVQTLTRAMAAILCRGLEGSDAKEIMAVPGAVISRIVGVRLMRLRSQTAYYVLERIREAVRKVQRGAALEEDG